MADLDIPQRQTRPAIRGYARDARGAIPLDEAQELTLLLQDGVDLYALPVTAVDPEENTAIIDGEESPINWEAPIGAGMSDNLADFKGKLKAEFSDGVQYIPQSGFITVTVSENVQEAA